MATKRFRCVQCGRDFSTGLLLRDHLKRRHIREDVRWWMGVENPEVYKFEA